MGILNLGEFLLRSTFAERNHHWAHTGAILACVWPSSTLACSSRLRGWSPSGLLAPIVRVTTSVSHPETGAQGLLLVLEWQGTVHWRSPACSMGSKRSQEGFLPVRDAAKLLLKLFFLYFQLKVLWLLSVLQPLVELQHSKLSTKEVSPVSVCSTSPLAMACVFELNIYGIPRRFGFILKRFCKVQSWVTIIDLCFPLWSWQNGKKPHQVNQLYSFLPSPS